MELREYLTISYYFNIGQALHSSFYQNYSCIYLFPRHFLIIIDF